MKELGWIKLHRAFLDWEWYGDVNVRLLAIHLILKANVVARKWQGITIGRGQLITSSDKLSEEVGISRQQVRTALKKLESSGFCNQQSTSKYTLLTISKYSTYQDKNECTQPTNNQQVTNTQPTNNQQVTTTKECKNIRNKEVLKDNSKELSKKNDISDDFTESEITDNTTTNTEPKEKSCAKKEKVDFRSKLIEIGVSEQTASDWMQVRKTKKATNTARSLEHILEQLRIAYKSGHPPEKCIRTAVERDWRGFEYKWLENLGTNSSYGRNKTDRQPTGQNKAGVTAEELADAVTAGLGRAAYNKASRESNNQG